MDCPDADAFDGGVLVDDFVVGRGGEAAAGRQTPDKDGENRRMLL